MYARTSSSSLPASFDRPADQIRMVPIFSSGPGFQIEPPRNKIRNKSNVIFLADGGSGWHFRTPALLLPILFWDTTYLYYLLFNSCI